MTEPTPEELRAIPHDSHCQSRIYNRPSGVRWPCNCHWALVNAAASAWEIDRARTEALDGEEAFQAGCFLALEFADRPNAQGMRVAQSLLRYAVAAGHPDAAEQLAALAAKSPTPKLPAPEPQILTASWPPPTRRP